MIVVTRHPALVDLLRELGVVSGLQSRVEKQAFQVIRFVLELQRLKRKLQSRVEKQAFQVEKSSNQENYRQERFWLQSRVEKQAFQVK